MGVNPRFEYLPARHASKARRAEILNKSKIQNSNDQNARFMSLCSKLKLMQEVLDFGIWSFAFVSCFGFSASDL
jgi:hypothetical protein